MLSANRALIRTQQAQQNVNGIPTQVVCTEFSNYVFIVVTQYGKVGTLISVTPESRTGDATMLSSPAFSTRVLLGKDEALTHVCAKHLAAAAAVSQEVASGNRPVLLALSLRDSSLDSVRQMRDLIRGMVVTSTSSSGEREAEVAAAVERPPDLDFFGGEIEAGVGTGCEAHIGEDMYIGADMGADVGAGADIGANMGADIGTDMGADIGADMYMGADIGANMGADIGVDMGADIGTDMYMGADIGADMYMGADIGADMYMGADIGADMYMGADVGADMNMGADVGADMNMGADSGEDLAVEDCPPLGATPAAPLLLREPPVGLFI